SSASGWIGEAQSTLRPPAARARPVDFCPTRLHLKGMPWLSGVDPMSEPLLVPCAACAGLNRIPADRLHDAPRCGRCKSAVLPATPFDLDQSSFASQLKGDLPLLVDVWAGADGPSWTARPTGNWPASWASGRSPA